MSRVVSLAAASTWASSSACAERQIEPVGIGFCGSLLLAGFFRLLAAAFLGGLAFLGLLGLLLPLPLGFGMNPLGVG